MVPISYLQTEAHSSFRMTSFVQLMKPIPFYDIQNPLEVNTVADMGIGVPGHPLAELHITNS
jgi:hypothetical protein